MPWKFNPFSGTLDQTGSGGGGGAQYIDGEVATYNDLPLDGTAPLDSAWLVREASGTWLIARKPAGIYIRTATGGTDRDADYTYAGILPDVFNDANFLLYDDGDSTKNLQFQLSGITTATTRTITVPDANITLDDSGDTRDPNPHGESHAAAGSDPVFDQDLNTTDSVEFSELTTEVFYSTDQFDIAGEPGITFSNEDGKINTRANLGLGDAATADIGTAAGEVAEGDHSHELDELDATGADSGHVLTAQGDGTAAFAAPAAPVELVIACSDETADLTTGTAKVTFRAPYAFTLTAVRASVNTAPTGSTLIVDINEAGTTVLSTKLSIDADEKTSTTAASAAVISDSAIADDAEITIDIDQIGSTNAGKGLKVALIGTRA